ncbi:MAG: transglycosylase SLT domain-containing protein [Mariprofundus sp.]|nr:transglycosylase SLT domain-containing protein [Mariprofundus sp.]
MSALSISPLLLLIIMAITACTPLTRVNVQIEKAPSKIITKPPLVIVTHKKLNPMLAGLTTREIRSLKAEVFKFYGTSWKQIAKRSRYVRQPLIKMLDQLGAPLALQVIPVVESSYNAYAESRAGATGLWQIMPTTAKELGINSNKLLDGRRDIQQSTKGAAIFLLRQRKKFGNWPLAFAAYHLGPTGVQRRINRRPWAPKDGLRRLPLPPITKRYIRHILGLIALQEAGKLRFPKPYPSTTIKIHSPIDLQRLHLSAALPKNQIFLFNPKLARMHYYKQRPTTFTLRISQIRLKSVQHIISSKASKKLTIRLLQGESLKDISKRYHVSTLMLRRNNPQLAAGIKRDMRIQIPGKNLKRAIIADNPLLQ